MSRRQRIEAMLADDPHDAFLRYSLALELDKEGNHERSLEILSGLMADSPPYVPAFLMAGQRLIALARAAEARAALQQGIEAAQREGNHHAAGEMSGLLASL
ncbi:MAG: hypothetical protein K1X74_16260 [Pirellulales bacterium]|nr:hypothetical protein [Pirellulales bacterium]